MAGRSRDIILRFLGDEKDLTASQRNVRGELDKTAKTAETTGSRFSKVGGWIKAAFAAVAVQAIAAVIGKLDQLGQKMQATERMADTVFGSMSDEANQWADDNNEAFGIGESALLSLISKTQDLLVPMGFARREAFGLSKDILNVANALSEWEGGTISATDAQLRIAKAMLGEREGLVELGVKLSDAEVKARLAAKGLRGLTGEALIQATALVTLEAIQDKSTDALTAYSARAGTATANAKALTAATEDTAETWAEILRPAIDDAKESMSDLADIIAFVSERTADLEGETEEGGRTLLDYIGIAITGGEGLEDLGEIVGWVADQTRKASEETYDHAEAQDADRQAAKDARGEYETTGGAVATMGTKFETAAGQIRMVQTALREQLSPAFALIQAQNRNADANEKLTDAQADYADAVDEFGTNSEEAKDALGDIEDAQLDVATSYLDMKVAAEQLGATIDSSVVAALERTLTAAGLSEAAIRRLLTLTLTGAGTPLVTVRDPNLANQGPAVDVEGGFIPRGATNGFSTPAAALSPGETVINNYNNFNVNATSDFQRMIIDNAKRELERIARGTVRAGGRTVN